MSKLRSGVKAVAAGAVVGTGGVAVWRRNRRIGTRIVNRWVNPLLLRRGLAGGERSEVGTLEHVGRRSGTRRLTPVYPEPTGDGFRIIVPLGTESQWARNVLAAGHCRLQLHDVVYELDEPRMVRAGEVGGLPAAVRRIEGALGFEYLLVRRFAEAPGTLQAQPGEPVQPAAGVQAVASVEPGDGRDADAPIVTSPEPPQPEPVS